MSFTLAIILLSGNSNRKQMGTKVMDKICCEGAQDRLCLLPRTRTRVESHDLSFAKNPAREVGLSRSSSTLSEDPLIQHQTQLRGRRTAIETTGKFWVFCCIGVVEYPLITSRRVSTHPPSDIPIYLVYELESWHSVLLMHRWAWTEQEYI
jgi:hypothetical protein